MQRGPQRHPVPDAPRYDCSSDLKQELKEDLEVRWADLLQPLCLASNTTQPLPPGAASLLHHYPTAPAKLEAFPHFRSGLIRNQVQGFY